MGLLSERAHNLRNDKCPVTGKIGKANRKIALSYANDLRRQYGVELRVYKCPACKMWHSTKQGV